jgi:hypothetical protein
MMTKDEALKMAVDALENVFGKGNKAINALIACKEALKQQEPRMFLDLSNSNGNHPVAQPAQDDEKRALKFENEHLKKELDGAMAMLNLRSVQEPILITRIACPESNINKPAQEPVALVYSMQDGYVGQMVIKGIPHKTKLYTHPHQWQGLTHDEIDKMLTSFPHATFKLARAISQALKEKNHD